MTGNTYVLKTVDDFRSIPGDRLADCIEEFYDALNSVAKVFEDAREIAANDGVVLDPTMIKMPEFIWTDDGKPGITGMPITYEEKTNGD